MAESCFYLEEIDSKRFGILPSGHNHFVCGHETISDTRPLRHTARWRERKVRRTGRGREKERDKTETRKERNKGKEERKKARNREVKGRSYDGMEVKSRINGIKYRLINDTKGRKNGSNINTHSE
jgi:hypothetical protein